MFRKGIGRASRFFVVVAALALAASFCAKRAAAQACCAGAGAVTPGRLAIHEDALVGVQVRAADIFGSFQNDGTYVRARDAIERDFEQDLFGALRIAPRAQLALLVPVVETYRRVPGLSDFGGGFGDVNLSARYDFVLAGESRVVPGIAALGGVTFPTGRADETGDPNHPLAADATGIGRYQVNLGLALEQTEGPWLFGLTGLYAKRTSRTVRGMTTSLGAEWTMLGAAAYTFPNDAAVALLASYAIQVDNVGALGRRIPLLTLSGLYPLTDQWRLLGGIFFTPPISQLGRNTPANVGLVFTAIRSWS
jgi:hypothetical protein